MIYKDAKAVRDTETMPAIRRDDACLHCGKQQSWHYGWSCFPVDPQATGTFSSTPPLCRYETQSMRDSIAGTVAAPTLPSMTAVIRGMFKDIAETTSPGYSIQITKLSPDPQPHPAVDLTDWRAWRDVNVDTSETCPCGIARAQCTYHGGGDGNGQP